jgi:uncharacterized membrane protein
MKKEYLSTAIFGAIFVTTAYVVTLMTTIDLFGEDGAKGVNGLNILTFGITPFVVIITFPLTVLLAFFIKDYKKMSKVLYIIAASVGILLGIANGLKIIP